LCSAEKADKNPFLKLAKMRAAPFFKTTVAALPEKTLSFENLSIWCF
jgi:hypothetical protein